MRGGPTLLHHISDCPQRCSVFARPPPDAVQGYAFFLSVCHSLFDDRDDNEQDRNHYKEYGYRTIKHICPVAVGRDECHAHVFLDQRAKDEARG